VSRPPIDCSWLEEVAAGYLRHFGRGRRDERGGLWGYNFARRRHRAQAGFFIGFLLELPRQAPKTTLPPLHPPECAVFAFVRPAGSALHREWVRAAGGPFRRAFQLVTKYTVRRPRFEFYERDWQALLRHAPLAAFPAGEEEKYARNFFMETLAILVRSGLPEKLARIGAARG